MNGIDFSEDVGYVSDDELKSISELANRQISLETEVASAEKVLSDLKERLRKIKCEAIPAAMDQAGVKEFTLLDGRKLKVEEKIKASIPEQFKLKALDWLRSNEGGPLIKNKVVAMFGMGQDKQATELLSNLSMQGLNVTQDQAVHPASLTKFVRLRLEDGKTLPEDLFSVFQYRETKIVTPKN